MLHQTIQENILIRSLNKLKYNLRKLAIMTVKHHFLKNNYDTVKHRNHNFSKPPIYLVAITKILSANSYKIMI